MALCQQNLVFRCDLAEGIREGLLSPFHYFGVPDEVDYENIPWRSSRFDEEALTRAVATRTRAENALEQYRTRGGRQTLAFCCSKRHADFMRDYFRQAGIRAAAVHSDPSSDPRAGSLAQLAEGELDIVFAVDMFNEGVDLPDVDTVMMLRPTESRILWLQQFGRGLRKAEGKERLTVIDYIGNHRTFLLGLQTLFELSGGDAQIAQQLERLQRDDLELPPRCNVIYELEAIEILRGIIGPPGPDAIRFFYEDFRERYEARPAATETHYEGYRPGSVRRGYGSWLGFVDEMGDLDARSQRLVQDGPPARFLKELETTAMNRSYKMLVLLAMLNTDRFPGEIRIDALVEDVRRQAQASPALQRDLAVSLDDGALERKLVENPIHFWVRGRGTSGVSYFAYEDGRFATTFDVAAEDRAAYADLVREIADWRLAAYLDRGGPGGELSSEAEGGFLCRVSHAGGRPILFLPSRESHPLVPTGWTSVVAEGEEYEANFVRVAVNVMRRPGTNDNVLAQVLRGWFGDDAGLPGTGYQVRFAPLADRWTLAPA